MKLPNSPEPDSASAEGVASGRAKREGYPADWARLELMVSPTGEFHSIGGDAPEGSDPRADVELLGMTRLRTRFSGSEVWTSANERAKSTKTDVPASPALVEPVAWVGRVVPDLMAANIAIEGNPVMISAAHKADDFHSLPLYAAAPTAVPDEAARLLIAILSHASPHDPHKNRSNAGRWVTINAPAELVTAARAWAASQPTPVGGVQGGSDA